MAKKQAASIIFAGLVAISLTACDDEQERTRVAICDSMWSSNLRPADRRDVEQALYCPQVPKEYRLPAEYRYWYK
jgi:hypothetical protein